MVQGPEWNSTTAVTVSGWTTSVFWSP